MINANSIVCSFMKWVTY